MESGKGSAESPLKRALAALDRMQAKLDAADASRNEPIAIIGMGCRFPGAPDPAAFWRVVRDGLETIGPVPPDRWDIERLYDPNPEAPGKMSTRTGGFLDRVDGFDAQFFRISPREAACMDPQQRLFLEVAWEALENAGVPPDTLAGTRSGVFVGITFNDYGHMIKRRGSELLDSYFATGNSLNVVAGRLSYFLGLQGPSMVLDTACSSSLVAIHTACQSLRAGDCDLAIVGGVNLILAPEVSIAMSKNRTMSSDGHCKPFDAGADGYVRGEGCGVVILKRMGAATTAGNPILASIRGSAAGHGGKGSGLTVPNRRSQEELIRRALASAGVKPGDVGYVEAHGTGTSLGDPIELRALGAVLLEGRAEGNPCPVGSLKANIGHLESAAGLAGLIKVVLCLQHRTIPPQIHVTRVNPDIPLDELRLAVPTAAQPWEAAHGPRIAGVSSFGFSGAIAHVVLQEVPSGLPAETLEDLDRAQVLTLSARSAAALRDLANACARQFENPGSGEQTGLSDICHTLSVRRTHHNHRLAAVGASRAAMVETLDAFRSGEPHAGLVAGSAPVESSSRGVVFIFAGQGSQHAGMVRKLLRQESVFKQALEECARALDPISGWPLMREIEADAPTARQNSVEVIQPVLFAIQVALAAQWRAWGIEPVAVAGHSMGEVAAAHVAGILSLSDAARVICARSALLSRIAGKGAMALVELSMKEAEAAIDGLSDRVSVAAKNAPRSLVLSGDPGALQKILARLERAGTFCRFVKVDVASHSPQVEPLLDEMRLSVAGITPQPSAVPFFSTVTGGKADGANLDAGYWARNLRSTVRFHEALNGLADAGNAIFLELGPHPLLVPVINQSLGSLGIEGSAYPSLRRDEDDRSVMLETAGALYTKGVSVQWNRIYPKGRCVALPSYPWQRERHWIETESASIADSKDDAIGAPGVRPLLGRLRSARLTEFEFESHYSARSPAFLADHIIYGTVVVPGASHLVLMRTAFEECFGPGPCTLEDVFFPQALVLGTGDSPIVRTSVRAVDADTARIEVSSFTTGEEVHGRVHAAGRLRRDSLQNEPALVGLEEIRARCAIAVQGEDFYRDMRAVGYELGPVFRWISEAWRGQGEVIGHMRPPAGLDVLENGAIHPALMDSCLQLLCAALPAGTADMLEAGEVFAPFAVERIEFHGQAVGDLWCHIRLGKVDHELISGDVRLVRENGEAIVDLRGLQLKRAGQVLLEAAQNRKVRDWLYQVEWRPSPQTVSATSDTGAWLIVGDGGELGEKLTALLQRNGESVFREEFPANGDACRGVIYLSALDSGPGQVPSFESIARAQEVGMRGALHLAQRVLRKESTRTPRFWLVTRGAQAVGEESAVSPAAAPIWGFGAVLAAEHPELLCTCIDLDPDLDAPEQTAADLSKALHAANSETQVALRKGARYAARVAPAPTPLSLSFEAGQSVELETSRRGVLDNLVLRPAERQAPGPGEVEIETSTTSLNLRDILNALGRGYPSGWPFGFECAGRVAAIGAGVPGLQAGDEVIAFTPRSFRSFVTTRAEYVARKPKSLNIVEASTIWAPFTTAQYALHDLAHVLPGERVLVHAAAGGTGLALVQTALNAGCEVFATASPSKWQFLRDLGVKHVTSSRSLDFAGAVMEWTNGEGVDVVVNSLVGDFIPKSLGLLRKNGRFLEMGKTGIWEESDVAVFRGDIKYYPFNLVDLCLENPPLAARLIREVLPKFEDGRLRPLPATVFAVEKTIDAFRFMAEARHIGRIVVAWDRTLATTSINNARIRSDATYVVTGGTGALGLEVARWLADRGARHLVLVSRRPPSETAGRAIEQLRQRGATVHARSLDVSRREEVLALFNEIDSTLPPVRGVIHAAGILDDATVLQCDWRQFHAVLEPKVAGAWNLHEVTRSRTLDFFVLFSGAAGMLHLTGQSNYAAANAFLDALASYRRGLELPGLSVAWGPWSSIGLAAARDDRGNRLAAGGIGSIPPATGIQLLERLLEQDRCNVAVIPWDMEPWRRQFPIQAALPFYDEIARKPQDEISQASSLQQRLAEADSRRRRSLLEQFLQTQVARVLRLTPSRVERLTPFHTLGFDSLMALEFRNRLEFELKIKLSATLVWGYPTVAALAQHLAVCLQLPLDGPEEAPEQSAKAEELGENNKVMEDLLSISDDEAAALLGGRKATGNAGKR